MIRTVSRPKSNKSVSSCLEEENKELRKQNEVLRGHVSFLRNLLNNVITFICNIPWLPANIKQRLCGSLNEHINMDKAVCSGFGRETPQREHSFHSVQQQQQSKNEQQQEQRQEAAKPMQVRLVNSKIRSNNRSNQSASFRSCQSKNSKERSSGRSSSIKNQINAMIRSVVNEHSLKNIPLTSE
jgi:hypothetical protein